MTRKTLLVLALFFLINIFGYPDIFKKCISGQPISSSDVLNEMESFNGTIGFYAKNLKTGKTISFQENRVFPTASTSKLIVALAVYKYIYPHALDEQKNLYDGYIKSMIEISDNEAFYILLNVIEDIKPEALHYVARDLGLQQTLIHDEEAFQIYQYHSVTTPREMATVMEHIYKSKYIDYYKSEELKNELANTIFKDEIPRYIRGKVMHKVGELDAVLCDVGIVDDDKNQVLISVYTITQGPHNYASDFIAGISAKAFTVLKHSDDISIYLP